MKIVLFVEGHTERQALPDFLHRWLDQRLTKHVGVKIVRFEGWPELNKDLETKAGMYLNGPDSADLVALATLLDLYGPDRAGFYPSNAITAQARLQWGTNHLQKRVNDPRFRAFFAVHELEAWILSQPALLNGAVAKGLPGKARQPETVNFNEPPAKLLEKLYLRHLKRHYGKVADGKVLIGKLDPDTVYAKCPNFKSMMDSLLTLAKKGAKAINTHLA